MKKIITLTAAALMSVAGSASAEDNVLRYAVHKPVIEIRLPEGENGRVLMTLEEFRSLNPEYANAEDDTIIPRLTPIRFTKS